MKGVAKVRTISQLYTIALPRALKAYHRYLIFAAILFTTCIVVGYRGYHPAPDGALPWAFKGLVTLAHSMEGKGFWVKVAMIFGNNLRITMISVALGWLLGLVPLAGICMNGVAIGMMSRLMTLQESWTVGMAIASFLPHGLFELPAFIAGQSIGLRIGFLAPLVWRRKYSSADLGRAVAEGATILGLFVVPMLALAALIELTITPALIRAMSPGFPTIPL